MKWWQILGIFALGVLVGCLITFPTKFEIVFTVTNETQDWYSDVWDDMSNYTWTNMCCFPQDCPQAVNNPEQCTCEYLVYCYKQNESEVK